MASDPNGGVPFAAKQRLTSGAANILRANDLIQLDTDGGNRAMSAKLTLTGTGVLEVSDKYLVTSRSITRVYPVNGTYDAANASYTSATGGPRYTSTSTTNSVVAIPISAFLENGNVFESAGFWFKAIATANANHHSGGGGLGVVPKVYVFSFRPDTNTETQLGTTTSDAVGTRAAYETYRLIEVTDFSHTIDKEKFTYYMRFEFESGAQATLGAYINAVSLTTTVTSLGIA
jgi:hypothetical protein